MNMNLQGSGIVEKGEIAMKTRFLSLVFTICAFIGIANAQVGGKFYGVFWDGSSEHFVTLNPITGVHTSLGVVPGVQWIDASFRVFDPDSGLFAFIGGGTSSMKYQVIDAATGTVVQTIPRNDNLKNPSYDPGTGLLYGTWWSDSSVAQYDTISIPGRADTIVKRPDKLRGTEYFAAINPRTGSRTDTPIPGLLMIGTASHFFDSDSGRYVLQGTDTSGIRKYYVIDVATGTLLAQMPLDIKLDFPVYNPVMKTVHGLWWSDSTVRTFDSLGRPRPITPPELKGTEYFVTIHADSTIDLVELPGVKWIANFNRTLDTDSGRYVFTGKEATGGIRYYVIDVETGAILSKTLAPARAVDHIVYAPFSSETYAGASVALRSIQAAKNGISDWSLRQTSKGVELFFVNPEAKPHSFSLLDMAGKTILRRDGIRSQSVSVETSRLKAGLYLFKLENPAGLTTTGKFFVK